MAMRTVYYQVSNLPALGYRYSEVGDKANESVYQFFSCLPLFSPVRLNFEESFLRGFWHHKIKLLTKFDVHSFSGSG